MDYLISFLEGMITFISPCLLPMLPVYVSYFTGRNEAGAKRTALFNALGFTAGFTVVFTALGAFAGAAGGFLLKYGSVVNIVLGSIIILFGLGYIGVIRLPFFGGALVRKSGPKTTGFFSSMLFGMVFSVGWTPCVGAFLGSALMLAASGGDSLKGIFMLLSYSVGLGVPFILSAVLIEQLKGAFSFIKKHYRLINTISGIFLIIIGLMMATGLMARVLTLLSL